MATGVNNVYVILIVIVIVIVMLLKSMCLSSTSSESEDESYLETFSNSNIINKLKTLDIMFFKMASCPYCIKMESFLISNNLINFVHVIDIQTNDGKKLAQQNQLTGFPSFVSKKTGKKVSGYTENIDQLLRNLE